jgi:myo-inositol catabolism protein IolS
MQYKQLGNSKLKVSKVALGTWQFGGSPGWGDFDINEGKKIIDLCWQNGVNLIDTAEAYGESEEIVGRLLKGRRKDFNIATKLTAKVEGQCFNYKTVKHHIEKSLKKLQTDYIDLYQIHWPKIKNLWHGKAMEKKDYEDILDSMKRLQKEGLTRYAGVSNFRAHHLKEFTEEAFDLIVSDQVPYSVLWRCYDIDGTAKFCKENNISLLAYSPLAQGLLTGRFGKEKDIKEKVRQVNTLFNEPIYSKALEVVEEIKKIASEIGVTPSQVVLKWAIEKGVITSLLVGARKLRHFEENVKALNINLTQEHITYIDNLSMEFQKKNLLPTLELWVFNCAKEDLERIGINRTLKGAKK